MSRSSKDDAPQEETPLEGIDWATLLDSPAADEESADDPLANYILATPRTIAILNLCDCKEQLERWRHEPLRLAQAAKSAHLSMQAALTDALAGSASIGAYDDKYIGKWIADYEASRTGHQRRLRRGRVMSFKQLLDKAIRQPLPWSGQKLDVSSEEEILLEKLTHVRHNIEHPHPESHFIEPFFISQTLPVAARLTARLLEECSHHYDEGEQAKVASLVNAIDRICADLEE